MDKIRIHKLAKDLGLQTKDLMDMLNQVGFKVNNHMAAVTEDEAQSMMKKLAQAKMSGKKANPKKEEQPKTEKTENNVAKEIENKVIKTEVAKTEAPKTEAPKTEAPKTEAPKTEAPKTETNTGAQGERKPYNNTGAQGERKPYNNTGAQGERKPYNNTGAQGERKPYNNTGAQGERKPYNNTGAQGERKPYNNTGAQGERKPYNNTGAQGERKPYNNTGAQGERKPYNNTGAQGERKPYNSTGAQGERKPYSGTGAQGERRPYNSNGPQGERKPYSGTGAQGERRPYNSNGPQGERKPYSGTGAQGERRPYNSNGPQGERKPYSGTGAQGERRPYNSNGPQGDRKPFNKDFKKDSKPGSTSVKEELMVELKKEEKRKELKIEEKKKTKDKVVKKDSKYESGEAKFVKRDLTKKTTTKKKRHEKGPKVNVEPEFVVVEGSKAEGMLIIGETIVVGELASLLEVQASDVITKLFKLGIMANINQEIKFETAEKIVEDYDVVLMQKEVEVEEENADIEIEEDREEDLQKRAPIVAVMGHVDHGKTTLLDSIRSTGIAAKEAGGITQHIGASEVMVNDQKIVFLDTPGHEAFTEMRARGAKVTDIAIIVVAADDGIMPQTVEAINHVKAAGVPLIIAINKIDKPAANIDAVRQELSGHGLLVEEWGGEVIDCPVSAKSGEGIDNLLQMILLVSEMEEFKANPNRKANGWVLESNLDKGRGSVATVIVLNGTLKVGDAIVAGSSYGKVRAMINSKGNRSGKVGPATAVEILGLNEVPNAGDQFFVVDNDKQARLIAEKRKDKKREDYMKATSKIHLEDLFTQMQQGEVKDLNLIVKADVQGSIEALKGSLEKISNEEVNVRVIHAGVGAITESDVMLASASNAIIIGFNVRPAMGANLVAMREQVDMRSYSIIYQAIEEIETAMKGMLDPKFVEEELGRAEVRMVFKVPGAGMAAGCYMLNGKITRNSKVRLVRDSIVIYDGEINSLRRFKDEVKEVATGYECGISLEKYSDLKEGDIIEAYHMKEIAR